MMLRETSTLPYSRHHSSFNQGLHLGVGAEAFLIKALIDSTDDEINSLITDPSKLFLGSLGVAWCTRPTSSLDGVHRFLGSVGSTSRPSLFRTTLA